MLKTSLILAIAALTLSQNAYSREFPSVSCNISYTTTNEAPSTQPSLVPQGKTKNIRIKSGSALIQVDQGNCFSGASACIYVSLNVKGVVTKASYDLPYSSNLTMLELSPNADETYAVVCEIDRAAPGEWVVDPLPGKGSVIH